MSATKIDARELISILEMTPESQNIMLVGKHGIGKSQILTRYYSTQGKKVVPFFLGQMSDPGDLIGLMHKDEKSGRSVFLPPYWWPAEKEPVVLFLDELNRARPEILQSVMDLALNKTLAGRRLPEGSIVISAVNEGDDYQLTELDPALVSRFNLYEFSPSVEEWLTWAKAEKLDPRVIDFIQTHPTVLDSDPKQEKANEATVFGGELRKSPDRRAWEKVARFAAALPQLTEAHAKVISGMIGASAAWQFVRATQAAAPAVTAEDLLFRFGSVKTKIGKLPVPELVDLNERVLTKLQDYRELSGGERKNALTNLANYLEMLKAGNQNETVAHLASLLDKARFATASELIYSSPKVVELLTEFFEAISVE